MLPFSYQPCNASRAGRANYLTNSREEDNFALSEKDPNSPSRTHNSSMSRISQRMRKLAPQVFFKVFLDEELVITSRVFAKSANPMLDLQVDISKQLRPSSRIISIEVYDANEVTQVIMNDSVEPHKYIGTANISIEDVLNTKLLGNNYKMTKNIRPD
jgi:hypothetical protein